MTSRKEDYLPNRIGRGCAPEHTVLAESTLDNSIGIVLDTHSIPEKEPDWDALRNWDVSQIGRRLVSLELKVGEKGWDGTASRYTAVPKSDAVPAYENALADDGVLETLDKDKSSLEIPIGNALHYLRKGDTHADSLVLLDRAVRELSARVGAKDPTPITPASQSPACNFSGTYKQGESVDFSSVQGTTFEYPYGPAVVNVPDDVIAPNLTTTAKAFPAYYETKETLANAIASIDYNLFNEVTTLRKELTELKYYVREAFKDINRIKSAMLNNSSVIINPIFGIDNNGLSSTEDATNLNYVAKVEYVNFTLADGTAQGTPFSLASDSDISEAIAGIMVLGSWPYSMIINLASVPSQYLPSTGKAVTFSVDVTAYDTTGNYSATASLSGKPL